MGAEEAHHERLIDWPRRRTVGGLPPTSHVPSRASIRLLGLRRRRSEVATADAAAVGAERSVGVERAAGQISYGAWEALKAQSREWPIGSCRPSSFAAGHRSLSCPQAQPS
jgi:hypothetical protein